MEDYRSFLVVAVSDNGYSKLRISATTKYHALDLAYNKHPDYITYQCCNVVRDRRKHKQVKNIMAKW